MFLLKTNKEKGRKIHIGLPEHMYKALKAPLHLPSLQFTGGAFFGANLYLELVTYCLGMTRMAALLG